PAVLDCDHNNSVRLHSVVHHVGKPPHGSGPHLSVYDSVQFGRLLNLIEKIAESAQKLISTSGTLLVVPQEGGVDIIPSGGVTDPRKTHPSRLTCSTMDSQLTTSAGFASSAASRRSSSAF